MNKIVNNFLSGGDKFMPEIHLRQSGSTYSAFEPFTKIKKEYKNLKKDEIQNIFMKTNWTKPSFDRK